MIRRSMLSVLMAAMISLGPGSMLNPMNYEYQLNNVPSQQADSAEDYLPDEFESVDGEFFADDTRAMTTIRTICGRTIVVDKKPNSLDDDASYNCHSYAWYYRGNFNNQDRLSISGSQAQNYVTNNYPSCFTEISDINSVQVNDIIVYIHSVNEVIGSGHAGGWAHSGIVVGFQTVNGQRVPKIKSKYGSGDSIKTELYYNSDYYLHFDLDEYGNRIPRDITFYRPQHNVNTSWHMNVNYKSCSATQHQKACPYCGRRPLSYPPLNENHNFVYQGSTLRCDKCGLRKDIQRSGFDGDHNQSNNGGTR